MAPDDYKQMILDCTAKDIVRRPSAPRGVSLASLERPVRKDMLGSSDAKEDFGSAKAWRDT